MTIETDEGGCVPIGRLVGQHQWRDSRDLGHFEKSGKILCKKY